MNVISFRRSRESRLEAEALQLWKRWCHSNSQQERSDIGRELVAVVRELRPLDDASAVSDAGRSWG